MGFRDRCNPTYSLTRQFAVSWREDGEAIFPERIQTRLPIHNPTTALLCPDIETVWQAIAEDDDWTGFYDLLNRLRA